ncbi:MAG: extracellular solute-binding protein [Oscillospiraceae bacterium]|nr:extracellular solute-binding protein [Oscillospiraceae bacterium]
MKKALALLLALAMVFALAACGGTAPKASEGGSYDIVVWVPELAVDLTKQQIADFNASNEYGINFNATVEPVSESVAANNMVTDVEAGGDIFFFAQDQFARLVQAGALNKLGAEAAAAVKAANDAGAVKAATSGEEMFAYPLTADNGYFMYYDKSVIPEEDVDSLEKLIADCEAAGKYFAFETNTSAWYIASWFFATGCVSEWITDNEGKFISIKDTFNSPEGLIAAKGMKKLVDSPMHLSASSASEFSSGAAVVVSGIWDYETAKGILGDNLGATDLPSFEVDGKDYHLGSFNGCKLLGVKPQADAAKGAALHLLAQYLTGEKAEMERFNTLSWGPANLADQASEAVQANPGLVALALQAPYSVPQGNIEGSWWDIAKVIGDDVKAAADEAGLQAALDSYAAKIDAVFARTEEEMNAWSVIGGICGSNWDKDFPMSEGGGCFVSEPLELKAGEEFKVRQGASWDVNFGADGTIGGPNVVVEEDGVYEIVLELKSETEATITMNKVEG